jgi:hypothetical protein
MSRMDGPRGGQFLAKGEDVIAAEIDRRRASGGVASEDWSSHEGALKLARRITQFHGGKIVCDIEPVGDLNGFPSSMWAVRSNLIYIMPKGSR